MKALITLHVALIVVGFYLLMHGDATGFFVVAINVMCIVHNAGVLHA